jgi:hypothetical protein
MSRKGSKNHFEKIKTVRMADGCIKWIGAHNGRYGKRTINGKSVFAHRHALEQKIGRALLPGECALHTCNYTRCVNPDHLFVGSQQENVIQGKERMKQC